MSPTNQKYNFSGKVALVTGSSTGLGEEMAVQFAQYGAKVVITGRNAEKVSKVAQRIEQVSGGVAPVQVIGDLLADDSLPQKLIDDTLTQFGRLDILVNSAGSATSKGNLASADLLEEFDQIYKLNVRSVVALTQLAVPHLEKTKGNVINISSISGIRASQLVYSSSKAALDMVTKTSALELGPKGIRVNSINPGFIKTEFLRCINLNEKEEQNEMYAKIAETTLMKRVGEPVDIANLALFLASDDAKNITGSIMVSDSGALVK